MDGRKFCARSSAAIATFITIAGLELTGAGSASAAVAPRSNDNVAAARAKADALSHQAAAAGVRHDRVQNALDRAVSRMHVLDRRITHERRTSTALKAAVAELANPASSYDAVPGSNAAPPPQQLTPSSSTLLTNVVVVTENTDGLAQRMNASDTEPGGPHPGAQRAGQAGADPHREGPLPRGQRVRSA